MSGIDRRLPRGSRARCEDECSTVGRRSTTGARATGGTRPRRSSRPPVPAPFSQGARPVSFAAVPLREEEESPPPTVEEEFPLMFEPHSTSTPLLATTLAPVVSAAPVEAPLPPRSSFLAEELADFDPFAPVKPTRHSPNRHTIAYQKPPASVKYEIPAGRGPRVLPSFERTVPDMLLEADSEPGPAPPPPFVPAQPQPRTAPARLSAPVRFDVSFDNRRRPRVIPSFEPTLEETPEMLAAASMPEQEPPPAVPRREAVTAPPRLSAPVKLDIPFDDRRRPRVLPSFEQTPDEAPEMLEAASMPEQEPIRAVPERQSVTAPPRLSAPVKFEIPFDDRRKPKVVASFDPTPEDQLPPIKSPPKRRETVGAFPRHSSGGMMWEFRFGPRRRQGKVRHSDEADEEPQEPLGFPPFGLMPRRRLTLTKRSIPTAPAKSAKLPPTREEAKKALSKPKEEQRAVGTLLQVGKGVTRGKPPDNLYRRCETVYSTAAPQRGATRAKVCEQVLQIHGKPKPRAPQVARVSMPSRRPKTSIERGYQGRPGKQTMDTLRRKLF